MSVDPMTHEPLRWEGNAVVVSSDGVRLRGMKASQWARAVACRLLSRVTALLVALIVPWPALVAAAPGAAASGAAASRQSMPAGPSLSDSAVVAAFLDSLIAGKMAEHQIPGAVVLVVKDGRVLVSRGYGYADTERDVEADPERTLFRVASVTKLFTIIAVLQLAEEGKIALDADVNSYLPRVHVANPFPRPVKVADLLQHTDGFEERNTRVLSLRRESMPPLVEVLARDLKPVVLPPGEMVSYGSFGTAVGGLLVEQVSGISFARYVQERIVAPLGMERTTVWQDFSEEELQQVAVVYYEEDGRLASMPFIGVTTPSTGGGSATAAEMARLMIALLQGGRYGDARILREATVQAMFARQFSPHPDLPGVTYGFFEHLENGVRGLVRVGTGGGSAAWSS